MSKVLIAVIALFSIAAILISYLGAHNGAIISGVLVLTIFCGYVIATGHNPDGQDTYYTEGDEPTSDDRVSAVIDEVVMLQTINVTCPCGRGTFPAPVFCNAPNIYTCPTCKSRFRVELEPESILITDPNNIENAYDFLMTLKNKEQE